MSVFQFRLPRPQLRSRDGNQFLFRVSPLYPPPPHTHIATPSCYILTCHLATLFITSDSYLSSLLLSHLSSLPLSHLSSLPSAHVSTSISTRLPSHHLIPYLSTFAQFSTHLSSHSQLDSANFSTINFSLLSNLNSPHNRSLISSFSTSLHSHYAHCFMLIPD